MFKTHSLVRVAGKPHRRSGLQALGRLVGFMMRWPELSNVRFADCRYGHGTG